MLSTRVKISNVTNLSDARYCAGMGVDMLGFSMDPGEAGYVSPARFREIRSWVSGVQIVGETRSEAPEAVLDLVKSYEVDALEVSAPALLPFLKSETGLPLLLRVDVDEYGPADVEVLLERFSDQVTYFVLESSRDTPLGASWKLFFEKNARQLPVLLGFGLGNDLKIGELVAQLPVAGISLHGSEEIRPGYKDYGLLMDILESLETED